ncbi:MAG: hypothetical protein KHZ95_05290 [Eubacterium sp.]|nr:hypothetical protein [Eubacterium sp.]
MVKNDIESLYTDLCNIYEYEEYTEGSVTKHREIKKYSNIKCRISYSTGSIFNKRNTNEEYTDAYKLKENIKLFLPTNIKVKEGSKFEVTHNGAVIVYCKSSAPAVYNNHIEIYLDNYKEWA